MRSFSSASDKRMRNGAGDGCAARAVPVKTNASDWLSCAASCSRRVCASFTAFGQNKSAPALFARSTCSADHQRFFSSAVSTTITRPGSMPYRANAGAYGTCGGAIKAIHLAGAHQRFQRGQDEPQFADALVVEQQLGQRRLRPAAAGQLAIQRGEAAGDSVFRPRQPISLPKQGVMQQFGERGFHSWMANRAHPGGKPGRASVRQEEICYRTIVR